jgi:hypothetical protein
VLDSNAFWTSSSVHLLITPCASSFLWNHTNCIVITILNYYTSINFTSLYILWPQKSDHILLYFGASISEAVASYMSEYHLWRKDSEIQIRANERRFISQWFSMLPTSLLRLGKCTDHVTAGWPGFCSHQGRKYFLFATASRLAMGPTHTTGTWVFFPRGWVFRGVNLATI